MEGTFLFCGEIYVNVDNRRQVSIEGGRWKMLSLNIMRW